MHTTYVGKTPVPQWVRDAVAAELLKIGPRTTYTVRVLKGRMYRVEGNSRLVLDERVTYTAYCTPVKNTDEVVELTFIVSGGEA